MKTILFKHFPLLLFLLLAGVTAHFVSDFYVEQSSGSDNIDTGQAENSPNHNPAELVTSLPSFIADEHQTLSHEYDWTNTDSNPFLIKQINKSCTCGSVSINGEPAKVDQVISPNQTVRVGLAMQVSTRRGSIDARVGLISADNRTVVFEFKSKAFERITVDRSNIRLVYRDGSFSGARFSLEILGHQVPPVPAVDHTVSDRGLKVDMVQTTVDLIEPGLYKRSTEYKCDLPDPTRFRNGEINIIGIRTSCNSDGVEYEKTITVELAKESSYVVTPSSFLLKRGSGPADIEKQILKIRRADSKQVEIKSIDDNKGALSFNWSPTNDDSVIVNVTQRNNGYQEKYLSGVITIQLKDLYEPAITIRYAITTE
jgi:hypothetical protein